MLRIYPDELIKPWVMPLSKPVCLCSEDSSFQAVSNIHTTWGKGDEIILDNRIVHSFIFILISTKVSILFDVSGGLVFLRWSTQFGYTGTGSLSQPCPNIAPINSCTVSFLQKQGWRFGPQESHSLPWSACAAGLVVDSHQMILMLHPGRTLVEIANRSANVWKKNQIKQQDEAGLWWFARTCMTLNREELWMRSWSTKINSASYQSGCRPSWHLHVKFQLSLWVPSRTIYRLACPMRACFWPPLAPMAKGEWTPEMRCKMTLASFGVPPLMVPAA